MGKSIDECTEEELLAALAKRRAKGGFSDVSQLEDELETLATEVKQVGLEAKSAELLEEDDAPKACPNCGRRVRVRRRNVARTLTTRSGKLTIRRHYHYCDRCKQGFYPRDRELGIPEQGNVSFELERRIADLGLNDTFENAAQRWSLHYVFPISENLVRRVVDRVGKRIESADDTYLQHSLAEPEKRRSKLVLIQNDGSMVPTRDGWKEAKVATITRAEHHSSNRELKRGLISESRYLAVVGGQEEFRERLDKTLRVEKARRATRVVWLADGALGNWRLANELAPGCTQILDWYHAIERAADCAKKVLDEHDCLVSTWLKTCKYLLANGRVEELLNQLIECVTFANAEQLAALNDLVRYYRNNRDRMRYDRYRDEGLPLGNGAAESAHRHVLQVRMKRAGQRWSTPRARRMARLRAAYQTSGPHRFHRAIRIAAEATRVAAIPKRKRIKASNR